MAEQEKNLIKPVFRNTDLELSEATAISPVDGRYGSTTKGLRGYFSEFAHNQMRIFTSFAYLTRLPRVGLVRQFNDDELGLFNKILQGFSMDDHDRIKSIEKTTEHDLKATEIFLREKLARSGFVDTDVLEMIRYGTTSGDTDNLSYSLNIQAAKTEIIVPAAWELIDIMTYKAEEWWGHPLLGRTHARGAETVSVTKRVAEFAERLATKTKSVGDLRLTGKFSGAVGGYNDFVAGAPEVDWISFSEDFIKDLGLEPLVISGQNDTLERMAELCDKTAELNTTLASFDNNAWHWIGSDHFRLPPRAGQKGSSVMSHKGRNQWQLEGSLGASRMAANGFRFFASELPDSMYERMIKDSILTRFVGEEFAVTLIALNRARADFKDFEIKRDSIAGELKDRWEITTAQLQTMLRRQGVPGAYDHLDELVRNANGPVTKEMLWDFIDSQPISDKQKKEMKKITPEFNGLAEDVADNALRRVRKLKFTPR